MTTNSFYYIDKPLNYTSFDIIRILKKKFNIKRIGHTGTLDPLASGGLLIATGNYTKLISYLEKDRKEYEFDIMLDGTTKSYDLGEKVEYLSQQKQDYFKKSISKNYIQEILEKYFQGEINQLPPKFSALKVNGKRAYSLARAGEDFELKKRKVTIFDIKILDFTYPKLSLLANVSAGTYIRSIASDLGEKLGTGGYISKLRRTKIANFNIKDSKNLDDISQDDRINEKKLFDENLFISLDQEFIDKINNGMKIKGNFEFVQNKDLFVFDGNNITHIVNYDGEFLRAIRKI